MAAAAAAPKAAGTPEARTISDDINDVMKLNGLRSAATVFASEEKKGPSIKKRIDNFCNVILPDLLKGVCEDPSPVIESLRKGLLQEITEPEISVAVMEALIRTLGKLLPMKTKAVKNEDGEDTQELVNLTEQEYRAELVNLVPPDTLNAFFLKAVGTHQKKQDQMSAGLQIAFNKVIAHMTETTKGRCEDLEHWDEVFQNKVLVADDPKSPSLYSFLILVDGDHSAGVCAPIAAAAATVDLAKNEMQPGEKFSDYHDRARDKAEKMSNAGGRLVNVHTLKGLLADQGVTDDTDTLEAGKFNEVLEECNKQAVAAVALRQCRKVHYNFYDSRINGWHDNLPRSIPTSLVQLKEMAGFADNCCDVAVLEEVVPAAANAVPDLDLGLVV